MTTLTSPMRWISRKADNDLSICNDIIVVVYIRIPQNIELFMLLQRIMYSTSK